MSLRVAPDLRSDDRGTLAQAALPVAARATKREKILVIKLGALGDFVQAMGPAAAIRAHHKGAAITLLTTAPFVELARAAPYFDEVWIDERPRALNIGGLWRLRARLRNGRFTRVYDLQTSERSSWYFHLMAPWRRPEWSGIASGCSHPHAAPDRDFMHTLDRQADQLRVAGIDRVPAPDLSWAATDLARFQLPARFLLLVPGGSAHRPEKRWPAGRYAQLANIACRMGLTPIVLGGAEEHQVAREIVRNCPAAGNLVGATSLRDIAALGRRCTYAIGNDTGPMHLLVAAGSPATVLYSGASDPDLTRPVGRAVTVLRRGNIAALSVDEVAATLRFG